MKKLLILLALFVGTLIPHAASAQFNGCLPGFCGAKTSGGGSSLSCSYTPVTTGTQGTAYNSGGVVPTASGGTGPYTYSETGTLPTGITLSNTTTGLINGTPSVSGSFGPIQVSVTDSASHTANCGAAFTLVISASSSKTYARGGQFLDASNGSVDTFSSAVGTATTTRVILIATVQQNTTDFTAVSVNGVAATRVATNAGNPVQSFWTIVGAGPGSGTQTVSLTGGAFQYRGAQVWYMDGLSSTTLNASNFSSGVTSPTTASISAATGDFIFAESQIGTAPATFSYSGSTDAPANTYNLDSGPTTTGWHQGGADWTASTTSASWTASSSSASGGSNVGVISFR